MGRYISRIHVTISTLRFLELVFVHALIIIIVHKLSTYLVNSSNTYAKIMHKQASTYYFVLYLFFKNKWNMREIV